MCQGKLDYCTEILSVFAYVTQICPTTLEEILSPNNFAP